MPKIQALRGRKEKKEGETIKKRQRWKATERGKGVWVKKRYMKRDRQAIWRKERTFSRRREPGLPAIGHLGHREGPTSMGEENETKITEHTTLPQRGGADGAKNRNVESPGG